MPSASKWARLADEALKERRPSHPRRNDGRATPGGASPFCLSSTPQREGDNCRHACRGYEGGRTGNIRAGTWRPHSPASRERATSYLADDTRGPRRRRPPAEEPPANELPLPQTGPQDKDEGPALSTPAPPARLSLSQGGTPPIPGSEVEPAGMTWQEAAERLERLRSQGEPWTSQHKMARQFGCSSGTINKAIRMTPELRTWANRRPAAAPRRRTFNDVVTDSSAQTREADPVDDAAIREFIEKAESQTKAWFLALSPEDQLEYLNDPDKHPKILGRKP